MWNIIINLIYEQSCERYLSEAFSVEASSRDLSLIEAQVSSCVKILLLPVILAVVVVSLIVVCAGFSRSCGI